MKDSIKIKKIIGLISFVVIFYLIFLILYFVKNNNLAFPHPNYIIKESVLLLTKYQTYISILLSILRLFICLLISFIIGLLCSVLAFKSIVIRYIINPFIQIFRTVPVISLVVVLIIIFGNKNACYVITCLMLIPIFYENIYQSFISLDSNIVNSYKLDANVNFLIISKIYLPNAIKDIKTSFIECIGLGFKVLVMSEYLSGKTNSLGYSILEAYQNHIDMVYVYAWTLLLIIISLIVTKLTSIIKNRI